MVTGGATAIAVELSSGTVEKSEGRAYPVALNNTRTTTQRKRNFIVIRARMSEQCGILLR